MTRGAKSRWGRPVIDHRLGRRACPWLPVTPGGLPRKVLWQGLGRDFGKFRAASERMCMCRADHMTGGARAASARYFEPPRQRSAGGRVVGWGGRGGGARCASRCAFCESNHGLVCGFQISHLLLKHSSSSRGLITAPLFICSSHSVMMLHFCIIKY